MTTLGALTAGEEFLFACQVVSNDPVNGLSLTLYGPARQQAGTASISTTGVMSGQLAAPLDQTPVTTVTGYAPVAVGDLMQSDATGETMVARWSDISADGTVMWSAAVDHRVVYPAAGWTNIGHVGGL